MMRSLAVLTVVLPSLGVALVPRVALAQASAPVTASGEAAGGSPSGGGGGGGRGAAPGGGGGGTVTTQVSGVQFFPGGVAPTPPGQVLGGGNVSSSSSRPKSGNETDTFDLGSRGGGGGVVRGSGASGTGMVYEGGVHVGSGGGEGVVPAVHVVKKGDTLWELCERYFRNPYQWPRLWSYNPQLQNPHWLEVGDQIRLKSATGNTAAAVATTGGSFIESRRRVPPRTVFLREEGFVEEGVDAWGEITGAPEDKSFLMDTDDVYLRIAPGKDVHIGQELSVYRPVRSVSKGKIVQLQGTLRVNQWNAKERFARATVIETMDVIERGARVAAIPRRFEVVPPVRNEKDIDAAILGSVYFHNFYAKEQVLYVDKGSEDGLRPGNRLLVTRSGDSWRQSLPANGAAKRIAIEADNPAEVETIARPRDEKAYPEETVAEIRVLDTHAHTSMCIVIDSSREIEVGEIGHARRGY